MDFYIRKNSTEPLLKISLMENGRCIDHEANDRLENSVITFSMKDKSGVYKIFKKPCGIISKISSSDINHHTYLIYYKWEAEDVDELGTYEATFDIKFYGMDAVVESNLIAPIREKLFINVI
jgi:hypothetical protein